MGHVHLGDLPRTRKWQQVVQIIEAGADAAQVASTTMEAARQGLANAFKDKGLVDVISMLMNLPQAARGGDFSGGLAELGLELDGAPTLMQVTAAVTYSLDAIVSNAGRTDLSEMAQMAAAETLASTLGERTRNLFGTNASDVERELGGLDSPKEFGGFMSRFFARFTERYLGYFLSRELTHHVGHGKRFSTLAQVSEFNRGLSVHCAESAKIVEAFSGQWRSKTRWQTGQLSRKDVKTYTYSAIKKLSSELIRRSD